VRLAAEALAQDVKGFEAERAPGASGS
jgi:hypothetical protein